MELLLKRDRSTTTSTPGKLYVNGTWECFTLEDVVRELPLRPICDWKIQDETAIPAGRYRVIIDKSLRWGREMPHVIDLPGQNLLNEAAALKDKSQGFCGIRIHSGNSAVDTSGCILLGMVRLGFDRILQSRVAYGRFFALLQAAINRGEEVTLVIVNGNALPLTEVV